ncbi:MAG: HEAT repeat domain-containing protein [Synechococcus sp. BS307-5m-G36]|nr:HEAT repeat domain-containing protein [Synechococcus sp. BS307-5m-G36]
MQNVLLPGAVGLLAVFLWLQRKPVKPMLSSTDASAVAQLNRTQLELVIEAEQRSKTKDDVLSNWTRPVTVQETISLQQALRFGMNAGPEERLLAVRQAACWGHRSVLPLLRRALHDSDPRVVEAAALAIEPFRSSPHRKVVQVSRPPRNVSRMR